MKPLVFVIAVGLATGTEAQTGPQSSPRPVDPPPAAEKAKAKDVPKMTTAEKNKVAKDVNKQMVNPDYPSGSVAGAAAANPLTREVTAPGGRFGVDDTRPGKGIVAPKAAPKSP